MTNQIVRLTARFILLVLALAAGEGVVAPSARAADAAAPVTLTADRAEVTGFAQHSKSLDALENWQGINTCVSWRFTAPAGEYELDVTYACDKASAGGAFGIVVGDERQLRGTVVDTGGFTTFRTYKVGTVKLGDGAKEVGVTTLSLPRATLFNLRRVTLRPVAGKGAAPDDGGAKPEVSKPARQQKSQTSIRGLAVIHEENGRFSGAPSSVTATVAGNTGLAQLPPECGPDMRAVLVDAESYVRGLFPKTSRRGIQISFEAKGPKDGRSAGAAFAVLLRSLAEGYDIDPGVCITGDITDQGGVLQIGGVGAKLRGGGKAGATIAVIPEENITAVGDLLVQADKAVVLGSLQVFSAKTVDQATAVARTDRDPKTAQAMALYTEVQATLLKQKIAALRNPKVQADLKRVLELTPNHVMAKYALDMSQNKGPTTLTRYGSIVETFAAGYPVSKALDTMKNNQTLRDACPPFMTKAAKAELVKLSRITHPEVEKLRKSYYDVIDAVEKLANAKTRPTPADLRIIDGRVTRYNDGLKELGTNKELLEKMMKEGY